MLQFQRQQQASILSLSFAKKKIVPLPKTDSNLGIDLGLENFAILSTGEKIGNPKFLTSLSKKLAKEQKVLSRRGLLAKKKDVKLSESSNYQKQKLKVVRLMKRLPIKEKDFLHKLSTNLIKNHDVICIEDLASRNLMKNHHLARAIGDVSWYEFVRQLRYKADWYEKKIVTISRWFSSSQLCSACGLSSGKKQSLFESGLVKVVGLITTVILTLVSISLKEGLSLA